jgi:CheY-like chemotaxis protein
MPVMLFTSASLAFSPTVLAKSRTSVGFARSRLFMLDSTSHFTTLALRGETAMGVVKPRAVVVDDHAMVREMVAQLLASRCGVEVVGEASNGCEALEVVDRLRPDLVVIDVSMPIMGGIEATRRILAVHPQTKVIALTMHEEPQVGRGMLAAGAADVLCKSGHVNDICERIRRVCAIVPGYPGAAG